MALEIELRPTDPRDKTPELMELRFTSVLSPHRSDTNVQRLTDEDLERLQAVVNAHLATA